MRPDLTLKANYPIFGDTVTFSQGRGELFGTEKQYVGVISEHNVDGPQLWEVTVDGRIVHVYGSQILNIKRTGVIPDCPTVEYDPETDPDLKNL